MRTPEETLAQLDGIETWTAREDVPDLVALVRHLVRERDEARALAKKACAERDAARAELIKGMIAQVARLIEERDAHERPLPNTNEPEDQHVPHIETEDEP